jgi:hypothetical protein
MDKELLNKALIIVDRIRPRPVGNEAGAREMQSAMTDALCIFPEIVAELQATHGQLSTLKQVAFNGPKTYRDVIIPKVIALLVRYRDEECEISTREAAIDEIIEILQGKESANVVRVPGNPAMAVKGTLIKEIR